MDMNKIPESLRPLKWVMYSYKTEWRDGEKILAAVYMKHCIGEYHYEFFVVTVNCDDGLSAYLDGDPWAWEIGDIDFFVRISR